MVTTNSSHYGSSSSSPFTSSFTLSILLLVRNITFTVLPLGLSMFLVSCGVSSVLYAHHFFVFFLKFVIFVQQIQFADGLLFSVNLVGNSVYLLRPKTK